MAITRFEVIDDTGRVLTRYPKSIHMMTQDDGRTLKVFLSGESNGREEQRAGLRDDIHRMLDNRQNEG